ncbi:lipase 1-like [Plodia interpunctella]|uniref:lipase 1-like n=1 Tax=Plodia interpunctella TaxID=58824 RepID=UPI0023689846|nr:lipase 1-like [Plodia interpunctella]
MFFYKLHITVLIVKLLLTVACAEFPMFDESKLLQKVLPQLPTFPEVAEKNGLRCEEYNITTSDGYILRIFRIPGDVTRPVLLMHGLLDSSDGYIIREEGSIGMMLAQEGYDVWVGNNRGNRYSRNHVTLNPDKDECFWNYSFHEMSVIDLPEIIDLVLEKTGQSQLSAVGHSLGNTIFYVLGSKRPEYNNKIKVLVALAPIAYLQNMKGVSSISMNFATELDVLAKEINYQEYAGHDSDSTVIARQICAIPKKGYEICSFLTFIGAGFDVLQLEPEFLTTLLNHFPAGTSRKTLIHLAQLGNRKEFAEYDYGNDTNLELYGSVNPPPYNLSKVTFDVVMYCGANDLVSTLEDVSILESQLPNVVKREVIDYPLWNHLDHLYGSLIPEILGPLLKEILAKYNEE